MNENLFIKLYEEKTLDNDVKIAKLKRIINVSSIESIDIVPIEYKKGVPSGTFYKIDLKEKNTIGFITFNTQALIKKEDYDALMKGRLINWEK